MLMAGIVKEISQNLPVLFFLIAIFVTMRRARRARLSRRAVNIWAILWTELTFYYIGFTMVWAGIFHAYFSSIAAPAIGWKPSPFEFELGWLEIGLGVAALLSHPRGKAYRAAVTIPFVIFLLAAASLHIDQLVRFHNYAPGNAGITLWFGDIFSPLFVAFCALSSRHE